MLIRFALNVAALAFLLWLAGEIYMAFGRPFCPPDICPGTWQERSVFNR